MAIFDPQFSMIGRDNPDELGPRALKTRRKFLEFLVDNMDLRVPWFDMGSGGSIIRDRLMIYYRLNPWTHGGDLDALNPFKDMPFRQFETVTCLEVIEHLFNPLFALQNAWNALSPGGCLYLTTPNDYSLVYKAEHLLSRKYAPHFHQFSERDLRNLLQRVGIKDFSIRKFFRSNTGTIARVSRNGFFVTAQKG